MTRRQHGRGEILMSDGISPGVQFFQGNPSRRIWRTLSIHERPESDFEATEIGTDIPRIGVASVQLPIEYETVEDDIFIGWVR